MKPCPSSLRALVGLLLCAMLAACGGGDPDDICTRKGPNGGNELEAPQWKAACPIAPPLDCTLRPDVCQ